MPCCILFRTITKVMKILQRHHSVPPSPSYFCKSIVSAPALAKKNSTSRWGTTAPPQRPNIVRKTFSLKTPYCYNPSTDSRSNERPHSSSQLPSQRNFAAADYSRLQSLGLLDLCGSKPPQDRLQQQPSNANALQIKPIASSFSH